MKRIVVLLSGSGSNLQAIIEACQQENISGASIAAVISNRKNAYGLERARQAGIDAHVLSHQAYTHRSEYDAALADLIDQYAPDLIVLAGFMRVLTPEFTAHYTGRLINIHPSLLPDYRGLETHQRVLDAKEAFHGCTVHYVSAELDGGPLIARARLQVNEGEDATVLQQRVQRLEHHLYPQVIAWIMASQLTLLNGEHVLFQGEQLPKDGLLWIDEQAEESI